VSAVAEMHRAGEGEVDVPRKGISFETPGSRGPPFAGRRPVRPDRVTLEDAPQGPVTRAAHVTVVTPPSHPLSVLRFTRGEGDVNRPGVHLPGRGGRIRPRNRGAGGAGGKLGGARPANVAVGVWKPTHLRGNNAAGARRPLRPQVMAAPGDAPLLADGAPPALVQDGEGRRMCWPGRLGPHPALAHSTLQRRHFTCVRAPPRGHPLHPVRRSDGGLVTRTLGGRGGPARRRHALAWEGRPGLRPTSCVPSAGPCSSSALRPAFAWATVLELGWRRTTPPAGLRRRGWSSP